MNNQNPPNDTDPLTKSKTRRKREARKRRKKIHILSSQNKWQKMNQAITNCRLALEESVKNSPEGWKNIQWIPPWTHEMYKQTRSYCLKELENHREGRMARIMGGPEQTAALHELIFACVGEDV